MEIMVTTQVVVIMVGDIIPKEVNLNGNILPFVFDNSTEYRFESIFVVLALLVLMLMFIQKTVQDLSETLIASWGKLHERKILYLNHMENSFIKEACCCLSYRGIGIL